MALTGTLRDFGIADILQLIGQQAKTGVLHLRAGDRAVEVHFVEGAVVKAESASRSRKDLLGRMMVEAGLLSARQLDRALALQKRSLRRLGDIVVGEGWVDREEFRAIYRLQTTETLYRLFGWEDGDYAFEQREVDWDRDAMAPIQSEHVLMEGFRIVDEWPRVRRRISSPEQSFQRIRPLGAEGEDGLGEAERRVHGLAESGRTVHQIVARSRLGEFETCKALFNLVEGGYLRGVPPRSSGARPPRGRWVGQALRGALVQAVAVALVLAAAGATAWMGLGRWTDPSGDLSGGWGREALAEAQRARLEEALRVWRVAEGRWPEDLDALVEARLVGEKELSYPYGARYYYRPLAAPEDGYVLLPPLP